MTSLSELTFGPVSITEGPGGGQAGLFRPHKGRRVIAAHRKAGTTPFVGASRLNNSVTDFADLPVRFPAGWVTLVYKGDGGTGQARYQPAPFNASDDVIAFEPISNEADEPALLMMAAILTHQCVPKFGFGYKLTLHRLRRQKVMVPIKMGEDGEQVVDWKGLSALGRELLDAAWLHARSSRGASPVVVNILPKLSFAPMLITDVFDSMAASSAWYDKIHIKPGPGRNIFLSQTQSSNCVQAIVGDQREHAEQGNCITMTLKTQATFYQPSPFYTAQNFLVFSTSIPRRGRGYDFGDGTSTRRAEVLLGLRRLNGASPKNPTHGSRSYRR